MPISGARFPNQIAICKHLLGCGYKVDKIMGTSGGAVTAMLLLISDIASVTNVATYTSFCFRLNAILQCVDSSWYMTPWICKSSILNTCAGIANLSMYNKGTGEMFVGALDIDISQQPETWIGTHCRTTSKSQLWCTKNKCDATIQLDDANYVGDDIKTVTSCVMASCALPSIVPSVLIGDCTYVDGGVSYASPLGPCMEVFERGDISYHVVYISPVRYSSSLDPKTEELEDDDIPNIIKSSIAGMVTGLHIPDRNNGIRFIGPNYIKTVGIGRKALSAALARSDRSERSFIELAPLNEVHANFLTLKKGDAYEAVKKSYEGGFSVRQWYVEYK